MPNSRKAGKKVSKAAKPALSEMQKQAVSLLEKLRISVEKPEQLVVSEHDCDRNVFVDASFFSPEKHNLFSGTDFRLTDCPDVRFGVVKTSASNEEPDGDLASLQNWQVILEQFAAEV